MGESNVVGDIIKDLKGAWSNRISNPLVGAFALSWLGVNYRTLLVIISGSSVEAKFSFIDTVLYPDANSALLKCVVAPLALALLYIYALPKPTERVYLRALEHQRELNKIARQVAEERLLSQADADSLMLERDREIASAKSLAEEKIKEAQAEAKIQSERADSVRSQAEEDLRKVQRMTEEHLELLKAKDQDHAFATDQLRRDHAEATARLNESVSSLRRGIAELKWALTYESAFSKVKMDSSQMTSRLSAMISAKSVELLVSGVNRGQVKFEKDGSISDKDSAHIAEWGRWQISDKGRLLIFGESDQQTASFLWKPESGQWDGAVNGVSAELVVQSPELRHLE